MKKTSYNNKNKISENILISQICNHRADYTNATTQKQVSNNAYRLSTIFYKRASLNKYNAEEHASQKEFLYKVSSFWLGKAYSHGNSRAAHKLGSAILLQYKETQDPSIKTRLEELEKLGIPKNGAGAKKLFSYSLSKGEPSTCWGMSQTIVHKNDPNSELKLSILNDFHIPINKEGQTALLIISALQGHRLSASKFASLAHKNVIHQKTIDNIYQDINEDVDIASLTGWAINTASLAPAYAENIRSIFSKDERAFFQSKAITATDKAQDLRNPLIKKYCRPRF